ncbi:MAG: hypothetical protein ABIN58_10365 [candidate division WOR-3 bacterium]
MKEITRPLSERFGIPLGFWEGWRISIQSKEAWISTPEASEAGGPVLRRGIRLARMTTGGWKITSEGAMVIGKSATRCVLDLDESEATSFLSGQNIEGDFPWPDGQVIIRWNGFPVGVGLLAGRVIKNQLRASRRLPPRKR